MITLTNFAESEELKKLRTLRVSFAYVEYSIISSDVRKSNGNFQFFFELEALRVRVRESRD